MATDVSKIFDIYNCLLSHDLVPAPYLAAKLNVSERTVYRYLSYLDPIVPIEVVRDKYGGFKLMDSYTVSKNCFTPEEFKTLVSILDSIDVGNKETVDSIRNKLFSTHTEKYETYSVMADWLIIDDTSWDEINNGKHMVKLIQSAINNTKSLAIRYQDKDGKEEERIIEPHILILKQGLWYIYAYCTLRKDFRLFKVSRIKTACVQDDFKRRPVDINNLPYEKWFQTIPTITVDFKLTKKIRPEIEDWIGVENVYESPSGEITASAKLANTTDLHLKILAFGSDLTVLGPNKLKQQIGKLASDIAEKYKNL